MSRDAIDKIRLDGGVLCLDFVNTIPDRHDGGDRDNLGDLEDLVYWAKKAGAIEHTRFIPGRQDKKDDRRSARFFSETIQLRELIYSIFLPLARQQKVKPRDITTLNKAWAKYLPYLEITSGKNGFSEQWQFEHDQLEAITAPIVRSARELLLSGKLHRVKECPSCGWLFFDSTKNGKRRWCSMEDCGSNAKALEYYYRKKKEKS